MSEKGEFLVELYSICDMGVKSITDLLNIIKSKENKIKNLLENELKEYEQSYKEIKKVLSDNNIAIPNSGLIAKVSSSIGMHMELMRDNSDTKIADMLTQGYTMGLLEITKLLKKYNNSIGKEELKIANDMKKYHNKNITELKKYL